MTKSNLAQQQRKPMPIRWQQLLHVLPNKDWNLTQAALEVGYTPRYVSARLTKILNNDVRFCMAREELRAELAEKYDIKTDELIRSWKDIEAACIGDFFEQDEHGDIRFKSFAHIPKEKQKLIESVKVRRSVHGTEDKQVTTTVTEVKLYKRTEALEHLGKIAGVYQMDNEQKKPDVEFQIIHFHLTPKR